MRALGGRQVATWLGWHSDSESHWSRTVVTVSCVVISVVPGRVSSARGPKPCHANQVSRRCRIFTYLFSPRARYGEIHSSLAPAWHFLRRTLSPRPTAQLSSRATGSEFAPEFGPCAAFAFAATGPAARLRSARLPVRAKIPIARGSVPCTPSLFIKPAHSFISLRPMSSHREAVRNHVPSRLSALLL